MSVWAGPDVTDDAAQMLRPPFDGVSDVFDPSERVIRLEGAANEVLSFRLALIGPGVLDVGVEDLTSAGNRIGRDRISIYRMQAVTIDRWPAWRLRFVPPEQDVREVADVLVPRNAPRGGLPAGGAKDSPLVLWFDVDIPEDAVAGEYRSKVHISSDGRVAETVDVVLTVWPFGLPDDAGPLVIGDIEQRSLFAQHVRRGGVAYGPARIFADDPARADLEAVLADTVKLLGDHGVRVAMPRLYPVIKIDANRQVSVDWTDYDRVASLVLGVAGRSRAMGGFWSIPFDLSFPRQPSYPAELSPAYANVLRAYLAEAAAHFADRGWLERSVLREPFGDPLNPATSDQLRHFSYAIRKADSRLRVVSRLFPQDMTAQGWPAEGSQAPLESVDVWAPPAQFLDCAAVARDAGSAAWLTMDRPPFSGTTDLRAPLADVRVLAWQGYQAGAEAVYIGPVNNWPAVEAAKPQACAAYDPAVLLYPGSAFGLDRPVPSVRLKALRRGVQDAAYLALLASRGREHICTALGDSLAPLFAAQAAGVHYADGRAWAWVRQNEWWRVARRIMADELLATVDGDSTDASDLPETLRWRRFMGATRRAHFKVEGVRVQQAGTSPGEHARIVCTASCYNQSRTPVDGTLRFEKLPVGWVADSMVSRPLEVPPGYVGRVALRASSAALAWNEGGVINVPLLFRSGEGREWRSRARLCHLTAQSLAAPISIDGDLEDWPTGVGNFATGFRLITAGSGSNDDDTVAPAHRTLAFVGRYADRLYFGIRCETDPAASVDTVRGNVGGIQDLVPMGHELVELLIDPTNAGTRSPADLFRIAVGPGGAVWSKGVPLDPPVGPCTSWPAGIRHATRVYADHWSVELELPLDAFPPGSREHAVWGLNVTRFDLATQEYSNWAGATNNVYDPLSLGNMTIGLPTTGGV